MKKRLFLLIMQLISVFIVSLFSYFIRPAGFIFRIFIYALLPIFSFFTAMKITIKGINPYLSWILPPVAQTLAGFLITLGIGPDPLPVFITAFLSLVGAATGDVIIKTNSKR